jgi:hypothetical protein
LNQTGKILIAIRLGLFDLSKHLPHGIHDGQERRGDTRIEDQDAVAKPAEKVLGGMSDRLQPLQTQKTRGPFNRV